MTKGYQAYVQNNTMVQSNEKLIEMLYEGLLKFISLAKRAIQEKDYQAKSKWINRSTDIFLELISSLSDDKSELTSYLYGLYQHQIKSLAKANIENSTAELDIILHVVKVLLETWREETAKHHAMA